MVGRDSSVGIATRYGSGGPGIESHWRRDFPQPSGPALGPTQLPVQWVPSLSPGVKRPGRGVNHPHPSSANVKERLELYLYSPFRSSWSLLWWTLPSPLSLLRYMSRRFRSEKIRCLVGQTAASTTCARDGYLQVWWYQVLYNTILTSWWWACRGIK